MPAVTPSSFTPADPGPGGADRPIAVLKFGSSVLPDESHLPDAVHEIYRWVRRGFGVIAVVSAFGSTTDELLRRAREYSDRAPDDTVAAFLATGEQRASALLALALGRAGVAAKVVDPAAIDLRASGPTLDATPEGVDPATIRRVLGSADAIVVPGFFGRTDDGQVSLFGRGGSDLTALFIAARVGASLTRLIKDVDGLYDRDPADSDRGDARRYASVTWADVLSLSEGIVQHKAVRFARDHSLQFVVARSGQEDGTLVGAGPTSFAPPATPHRRLRIAIAGLGTVGGGVYRELSRRPDLFEITGVGVRRNTPRAETGVPAEILTNDLPELVAGERFARPDVLIEVTGAHAPARALINDALSVGIHVVSANKAILAAGLAGLRGPNTDARLLYSAAVGGAAPLLELAERASSLGKVARIRAVLNGTTTYILSRIGEGLSFEAALAEAQARGYAESDPEADLSGSDAACKLILLVRAAFGVDVGHADVSVRGIEPARAGGQPQTGRARVRLVARAERVGDRIVARVSPEAIAPGDPLWETIGTDNRLIVELEDGRVLTASGHGAGRWPTTESVIADVHDLLRDSVTHGAFVDSSPLTRAERRTA